MNDEGLLSMLHDGIRLFSKRLAEHVRVQTNLSSSSGNHTFITSIHYMLAAGKVEQIGAGQGS